MKKYYYLYTKLKQSILNGHFSDGQKLPSKRVLADRENVSIITVEKAYALLEDEGYIAASQRKGYFVLPVRALKPRSLGENEKLNLLALPQPQKMRDFQYSLWIKTTRKVLSEQQDRLFVKAPAKGCEVLRNAIAEYLLHYRGYLAQPERIVIGSGAEQLYENIVKLLGREKIYAVENPSYAKIQAVYREMGAEVRLLPISDDGIDGDVLQKSGANVLHVTPYRSFPSGITTSAAKKFEYLRWAEKTDAFIVEDDYTSEFFLPGQPRELLTALDVSQRVIYINTFSKSLSPSLRIGYMILPKKLLPLYDEKLGDFNCSVPVMDQYVLAEFIGSGNFVRHLNHVRRALNRSPQKQ